MIYMAKHCNYFSRPKILQVVLVRFIVSPAYLVDIATVACLQLIMSDRDGRFARFSVYTLENGIMQNHKPTSWCVTANLETALTCVLRFVYTINIDNAFNTKSRGTKTNASQRTGRRDTSSSFLWRISPSTIVML